MTGRVGTGETEAGFQQAVVEYATLRGWIAYHTYDSRRSQAGYPDLTLVRSGQVVFAEIKAATGRVSPAQKLWLDALAEVAARTDDGLLRPPVRVFLWRPSDWPEVEQVLR